MKEITVSSSRLPTRTGSQVPGYPGLTVGKRLGGSPYTLDRIYDLVKEDGTSSGLVIKVCWQPLGFSLGMSMRALEHEWVMYNNIEVLPEDPWACLPRCSCLHHMVASGPSLNNKWCLLHCAPVFLKQCRQVFCSKHPELSVLMLHAQAAIFTSDTTSSIFGCCPGVPGLQQQQQQRSGRGGSSRQEQHHSSAHSTQQLPHSDSGGSSSCSRSSGGVQICEVTPGDAANSISSTTSTPKRTTAALIVEKADGLTVKQRIKKPDFTNIRYIAQLLLQLPRLLAVLEDELGFVHDDLRLDNIMEVWQQQQRSAAAATPGSHSSRGDGEGVALSPAGYPGQCEPVHARQQQQAGEAGERSSSTPLFKLFDFGLSMINPDRFSRGDDSRAKPEQKKEALKHLQKQGYAFHKALGAVNLVHVVQFGRAADIYRLCRSLVAQLTKRTWCESDRHLVEACLQLLSTVSGKPATAYFRPDEERRARAASQGQGQAHVPGQQGEHHQQRRLGPCSYEEQQQQQQRYLGEQSEYKSSRTDLPGILANTGSRIKVNTAAEPVPDQAALGSDRRAVSKIGCWLRKQQMRRGLHKEAIAITARQLMQLQQYQQLSRLMEADKF